MCLIDYSLIIHVWNTVSGKVITIQVSSPNNILIHFKTGYFRVDFIGPGVMLSMNRFLKHDNMFC